MTTKKKKDGGETTAAAPGVVGRYPVIVSEYRAHRRNETRSRKEAWRLNDLHHLLTGDYIEEGADE